MPLYILYTIPPFSIISTSFGSCWCNVSYHIGHCFQQLKGWLRVDRVHVNINVISMWCGVAYDAEALGIAMVILNSFLNIWSRAYTLHVPFSDSISLLILHAILVLFSIHHSLSQNIFHPCLNHALFLFVTFVESGTLLTIPTLNPLFNKH